MSAGDDTGPTREQAALEAGLARFARDVAHAGHEERARYGAHVAERAIRLAAAACDVIRAGARADARADGRRVP